MRADVDKLLMPLRGRPVVAWSIAALQRSGVVDSIVMVASEHNLEQLAAMIETVDFALPLDSVGSAVRYLEKSAPELVLVHDGARPLVSPELVRAVLDAAREHGAATAALPLKNACKEIDGNGFVRRSLERAALVSVQTPQAFRYELLARAHREGLAQGAVVDDDAELVELLGEPVKVVPGDYRNLKITTPDDLAAAEANLAP